MKSYSTEKFHTWLDVFPEISLIADQDLAAKVTDVLNEAMEIGEIPDFDELAKLPFLCNDPSFGWTLVEHVREVIQIAEACYQITKNNLGFCGNYVLNHDCLIAGAVLHDVGKIFSFDKISEGVYAKSHHEKMLRHCFSGAGLAIKHGLPEMVVHIIATHSAEGDGQWRCPESVLLNKADFISFDIKKAAKQA